MPIDGESSTRPTRCQTFSSPKSILIDVGSSCSADERLICGRRFAGSDTTAISSRPLFCYLITNSSTYCRLVSEIDLASADGQLSDPIAYAETFKLPYLCACIKGAMRLHPSIAFTLPRIVSEGGDHIAGRLIPAGYRVGQSCSRPLRQGCI
jgi:hypothetical protein